MPDPAAEAALLALAHRLHGEEVAVLSDGREAWWARSVDGLVLGLRHARRDADRLLRCPVLTHRSASLAERAVVQVGARRLRTLEPRPGPVPALVWRDAEAWAVRARRLAQDAAVWLEGGDPWAGVDQLAAQARRTGPRWTWDQPVGAVLCDDGGRPVLGARNLGGTNRVLHAERVLVEAWRARHGALIPAGWQVCVGLSPCRMCAACLVEAAQGPLDVVVAREDPGRLAQGTALQARAWQRLGGPGR